MEDKPSGQEDRNTNPYRLKRVSPPRYAFPDIDPEKLRVLTAECDQKTKERECR